MDGSTISPLQGEAWVMYNASFGAPDADPYRTLGRRLYQQDVHERIEALYARLDEQNARLDAILAMQRPAA